MSHLCCALVEDCRVFVVNLDEIQIVEELEAIQAKRKQALGAVDACLLTLYKGVINQTSDMEKRSREIKQLSENLQTCSKLDDPMGQPSTIFQSLPEGKIYIVLVQIPQDELPHNSPLLGVDRDFRPMVTLKVHAQKNWNAADLRNNGVNQTIGRQPDYIENFRRTLIEKRIGKNQDAVALLNGFPALFPTATYFDVNSHTDNAASNNTLESDTSLEVTPLEASLYNNILRYREVDRFDHNREAHISRLLFDLDSHVHRVSQGEGKYLKFNGSWDFHLIIEVRGEKRQYTPRSDASLCLNSFLHLLLEVTSNEDHEWDRFRMLLQATCLARLGRALRDESALPFIVSAIYIDGDLNAEWYLVYQPNKSDTAVGLILQEAVHYLTSRQVNYVVDQFNLRDPMGTFKFVFQLYNLVSLANKDNATLHRPLNSVMQLRSEVANMKLPALTSDDGGTGESKKSRNAGEPAGRAILSDAAIMEALEHAGYTLPPEDEEFPLLLPLTAKTLDAVSPHQEDVILKLTDQHEVEVLRRLHDNETTKETRIIPLLDVVDGRLMVLPRRKPLSQFLDLDASGDDAGVLAMQFLEGVAYLQSSSVAHLDLKPDNIVVQCDPESKKVDLAIIDFNISIFADTEPTISSSSGTPGWCAPEVSAGKPYDPLLADRWSCGRVLTFFMEHMKPSQLWDKLHSLSQQMMDPDPSLRPPDPDPSLQPPVPDLHNLYPQEMEETLNPSIQLIVSGAGGAPRPKAWELRSSRRFKGHELQLKRKLGADAEDKEAKRKRKGVQPGSRLVSQRAV